MNVREFVCSLFTGMTIPEAFFATSDIDFEQEYSPDLPIGDQLLSLVEGIINMVVVKSVSENGFSMSWDTDRLSKLYLWLCRKYNKKPDAETLANLGVSAIIDISDTW